MKVSLSERGRRRSGCCVKSIAVAGQRRERGRRRRGRKGAMETKQNNTLGHYFKHENGVLEIGLREVIEQVGVGGELLGSVFFFLPRQVFFPEQEVEITDKKKGN